MADNANLQPLTWDQVATIPGTARWMGISQAGEPTTISVADYVAQYPPGTVIPVSKNAATQTNNSNTVAVDITGMSCPVIAGRRYVCEAWVPYQSNAATTTGIGFGWSGPAMTTFLGVAIIQQGAAGTDQMFTGVVTATGAFVTSASVVAINTTYLAEVKVIFQPSANGTLQLRFRSEVNASQVSVMNGAAGYLIDCG